MIKIYGVQRHLGYFITAEEAARAYDLAAIALYGEFAQVNFPKEAELFRHVLARIQAAQAA